MSLILSPGSWASRAEEMYFNVEIIDRSLRWLNNLASVASIQSTGRKIQPLSPCPRNRRPCRKTIDRSKSRSGSRVRGPPIFEVILDQELTAANDFSYDGSHGPSHWGEEHQVCVGKHQSPINIEEHNVKTVNLAPLRFIGLENPRSSYLLNNGHTVMLRANDSEAAMITGGPIGNETYVFEQLHFHWGENDREGSEDLINNHSFAMELHAVFYKQAYKTMSEAMNNHDGLTVLAYFYEVGNQSNPTYDSIVSVLPSAETVGATNILHEPRLLSKLLVPNLSTMQNYYTYEGSLTTPPCLEVVTWIDFVEPQILSHEQLEAFRNVQSSDGHKLTHNFRPIQPLNGRLVYHNVPGVEDPGVPRNISRGNHRHRNPEGAGQNSGQRGASSYQLSLALLGALLLAVQQ